MNRMFIFISIKTNLYISITIGKCRYEKKPFYEWDERDLMFKCSNISNYIIFFDEIPAQFIFLVLNSKWLHRPKCVCVWEREKTASIAVIIFVMYDNLNSYPWDKVESNGHPQRAPDNANEQLYQFSIILMYWLILSKANGISPTTIDGAKVEKTILSSYINDIWCYYD